ncbi:MAG: response regulator [Sulfurimonas sp.]|jgi:DNA-binding response OmpR family regulator|nr:response regulator [Sulfurimonas sp.]
MYKELLAKLQGLTILYAEDEEGIRKNIADSLRYYVKEVYEASDGEEAYLLYEQKKPDIIFSDIHMPKMDGIEFIKKVRERDAKTAVIMITAHTDKEYLLDAVELHMEKYFVKPINLEQLLEGLQRCVLHLEKNKIVVLDVDDAYVYDFDNKELKYKDKVLTLNKKEMLFFETLIKNQNRITNYEELQGSVWVDDVMTDSALRSLVRNLRKKLPTDIIYNLSGVGYKFV